MPLKITHERIAVSVYRENDTPATRTTMTDEAGNLVQIVRHDDGSTPNVAARLAGQENAVIKVMNISRSNP